MTYGENKKLILDAIEKIKIHDPEKGNYVERHVIFDDKRETIQYTGTEVDLNDVLEPIPSPF